MVDFLDYLFFRVDILFFKEFLFCLIYFGRYGDVERFRWIIMKIVIKSIFWLILNLEIFFFKVL